MAPGLWSPPRIWALCAFILASLPIDAGQRPAAAEGLHQRITEPAHLPYAPNSDHVLYWVNGHYLRPAAAAALVRMAEAARRDGVHLLLRSGYRTHDHQSRLFFGGARARGISLAERARVSAPPGFSEHHTGFAIDLDDAEDPRFLRQSFDQTRAGKWLFENAARFCFEMSFPRGNPQGVVYEPWHWRFIGTVEARRIFAPAREMLGLHGDQSDVLVCGQNPETAARLPQPAESADIIAASDSADAGDAPVTVFD